MGCGGSKAKQALDAVVSDAVDTLGEASLAIRNSRVSFANDLEMDLETRCEAGSSPILDLGARVAGIEAAVVGSARKMSRINPLDIASLELEEEAKKLDGALDDAAGAVRSAVRKSSKSLKRSGSKMMEEAELDAAVALEDVSEVLRGSRSSIRKDLQQSSHSLQESLHEAGAGLKEFSRLVSGTLSAHANHALDTAAQACLRLTRLSAT